MISRWNPWNELNRLQRELNELFERRIEDGSEVSEPTWRPQMDIFEDQDAFLLSAELPGIEPGQVEIKVENDLLTLSGERVLEHEDRRDNYHRIERTYGQFARSFTLPESVDAENISARSVNGVLTVTIPKKPEVQPRQISVTVTGE
jgi:HSP20 family protein